MRNIRFLFSTALFTVALNVLPITSRAEHAPDTIRLKVDHTLNESSNEQVIKEDEFDIISGTSIVWRQNSGSKEYVFEILNTSGNWPDFAEDGSLVYSVRRSGIVGVIIIGRKKGEYFVRMNFERNGDNLMPYKFNVSSIDY